jgi:glycosyltransferase involved in cell wall biosynthesis
MIVVVNALSIGSLSGRHVLFGHLRQLAAWTESDHEYVVLLDAGDELPSWLDFANVSRHSVPARSWGWMARSAWETFQLPALIRKLNGSLYLSCSGTSLPKCPVPQVILAPNPWCLVKGVQQGLSEHVKAWLQRWAYRRTVRQADLLAYISEHLRSLYLQNAPGLTERASVIASLGINSETFFAAEQLSAPRETRTVLSVSAMAPWKGTDELIDVMRILRERQVDAKLRLVGPWPDQPYRSRVLQQIADAGLQDRVEITGQVSVDQLHREYGSARVYALLSRCESFGIPALEAQAFGTPVLGSSVCAMPEVCGSGGVYCRPGDTTHAADLLQRYLMDDRFWEQQSQLSRENASQYTWERCSQPLMKMFELPGVVRHGASAALSSPTLTL